LWEKGYSADRWEDKSPVKNGEKVAIKSHKFCLNRASDRKVVAKQGNKYKAKFDSKRHELVFRAKYTPYKCGNSYWAIPCSIIACESGFDWYASNPSGAVGPYQLLGWGAPYPADTQAEKEENHRIAASVWAGGSGRSNWVC
jgi:hypothetical protein